MKYALYALWVLRWPFHLALAVWVAALSVMAAFVTWKASMLDIVPHMFSDLFKAPWAGK